MSVLNDEMFPLAGSLVDLQVAQNAMLKAYGLREPGRSSEPEFAVPVEHYLGNRLVVALSDKGSPRRCA